MSDLIGKLAERLAYAPHYSESTREKLERVLREVGLEDLLKAGQGMRDCKTSQPASLYALVERWELGAKQQWQNGDNGQSIQAEECAKELREALKAWDAKLAEDIAKMRKLQWTYEVRDILGLPREQK